MSLDADAQRSMIDRVDRAAIEDNTDRIRRLERDHEDLEELRKLADRMAEALRLGADRIEKLEAANPNAELVKFADVMAAQLLAAVQLVEAGGNLKTANLDDKLFTDRLRDTFAAYAAARGGVEPEHIGG